jgi:hypothetical protein
MALAFSWVTEGYPNIYWPKEAWDYIR